MLPNFHFRVASYREHHLLQAELNKDNDLRCIYHLTESHCPTFRHRSLNLYMKAKSNSQHQCFPMLKDNYTFQCFKTANALENIEDLQQKLEEMPAEWTMVQLTPQLDFTMSSRHRTNKIVTNSLYFTVFNCGKKTEPLLVYKEAPLDAIGNRIEIMQQFHSLKQENDEGYQRKVNRLKGQVVETYSEYLSRLTYAMKDCLKSIQEHWLGPWRVLFLGEFLDKQMEIKLKDCLERLLEKFQLKTTSKTKTILRYAIKGQHYLQLKEIRTIVKYCWPNLENGVMLSLIKEIKNCPAEFAKEPRNPVILVLDASIDLVPWEMIDVLSDQPVSRMQSFHFTYGLYREHEETIEKGYKMIDFASIVGNGFLNPGGDLKRMENRMRGFYSYWVPTWKILYDKRPSEEEFMEYLMNCDVFCYCGHGDGFQFISAGNLQKVRVGAVVLLFGCSSVQLQCLGPLCEPLGSSQNYITSCSPCIVGNLWNISDIDCDILSTNFISRWVRSEVKTHWLNQDLNEWRRGETVINFVDSNNDSSNVKCTGDLLLALNKAKKCGAKFLTEASCVARGIPVKIRY